MTFSPNNFNTPAPVLFTKINTAVSQLTNAAIVILLAMGYTDNSLVLLIIKVGTSAIMGALGAFLAPSSSPLSNQKQ